MSLKFLAWSLSYFLICTKLEVTLRVVKGYVQTTIQLI